MASLVEQAALLTRDQSTAKINPYQYGAALTVRDGEGTQEHRDRFSLEVNPPYCNPG